MTALRKWWCRLFHRADTVVITQDLGGGRRYHRAVCLRCKCEVPVPQPRIGERSL